MCNKYKTTTKIIMIFYSYKCETSLAYVWENNVKILNEFSARKCTEIFFNSNQ